jgi:hypothetical protein
MITALVAISFPTLLIYGASLVLVMWAVVDMARRPTHELSPGRKTVWILAAAVGWLLLGIVGAFVAIVYLVGPRKRMDAQRL